MLLKTCYLSQLLHSYLYQINFLIRVVQHAAYWPSVAFKALLAALKCSIVATMHCHHVLPPSASVTFLFLAKQVQVVLSFRT